jgi:hypothetical protein
MVALMEDLGYSLDARVHSDSSAAIGISNRKGLGKLRHLNVQFLWVQDKIKDKSFTLHKVPGERNPADLMTKHLDAATAGKHLATLGFVHKDGRATVAPELNSVTASMDPLSSGLRVSTKCESANCDESTGQEGAAARAEARSQRTGLELVGLSKPPTKGTTKPVRTVRVTGVAGLWEGQDKEDEEDKAQGSRRRDAPADQWDKDGHTWSRVHLRPRSELFTPLRVENSPPARSLFSVRVTKGQFCDSGERFTKVDAWTDKRTAHMPMRALWTGTTTFVLKPQLISSAVQCSRAERGSESCGLVYSRCPYIESINSSSQDPSPVPA